MAMAVTRLRTRSGADPSSEATDLRTQLRAATRGSHAILDGLVSAFDIADRRGLAGFLGMQWSVLSCLHPAAAGAATAPVIEDLLHRAAHDLAHLRHPLPPRAATPLRPHPLAIDYVVAGSRLGAAVLRERWRASGDPAVQRAGAYFSAPAYLEHWRAFCATAEGVRAAEATGIVQDAVALFELHIRCARDAAGCGTAATA